ncbi:hypothetical protein HPB50_027473 [Hyalomma asiaticum]|uniref:Uncharacterized protein n=1 Tax=Hyalomma asiaticum TaxID=266040 RepID=A0ACB7T799_HYAAI|nr:hypothetical protein HPB50_027473 [Hyalomma asiaticum]
MPVAFADQSVRTPLENLEIAEEGILNTLLHIDIKKSPGPDQIPNEFFCRLLGLAPEHSPQQESSSGRHSPLPIASASTPPELQESGSDPRQATQALSSANSSRSFIPADARGRDETICRTAAPSAIQRSTTVPAARGDVKAHNVANRKLFNGLLYPVLMTAAPLTRGLCLTASQVQDIGHALRSLHICLQLTDAPSMAYTTPFMVCARARRPELAVQCKDPALSGPVASGHSPARAHQKSLLRASCPCSALLGGAPKAGSTWELLA